MSDSAENQKWKPCRAEPQAGETIRWIEPVWAAPSKPRGKPDQIGEQVVIAKVITPGEVFELTVIDVSSVNDEPVKIKPGDQIRRKATSIAKGDCHTLIQE